MTETNVDVTATSTSPDVRPDGVRILGFSMVIVLLGQLVLGMMNTFWLSLPESGPGWKTASPGMLLGAHAMLGTLLVVLAVWLGVVALRRRSRVWVVASSIGALGIIVAFGAGTAFMSAVSNDGASFAMAVGCALAIAAYAYGLFASPARTQ